MLFDSSHFMFRLILSKYKNNWDKIRDDEYSPSIG